MSKDPLNKNTHRVSDLRSDDSTPKIGVRLIDIDRTIMGHIETTVLPQLEVLDDVISIPLLYGSPERWKSVKKDGFLRDKDGMVQIPLTLIRRTSVERNDDLVNPVNRQVSYPVQSRYSEKHKYDLFSKMTGVVRPIKSFNITIPDYVILTYDFVIWTDYIEHMNEVVEAFQFATDTYWGDKDGFKFISKVSSFDTTTEVAEGSQRLVKTTFTISVNAYLLPEKFDNRPTTSKSFSPKKILWTVGLSETDQTQESPFNPEMK